jgi:hypothetical protein
MSRERMPWCAKVIDGLREAFGRLDINEVIRRGLRPDCEPVERVYLRENGEALGKPFEPPASKIVAASQMVIGEQVVSKKRGRA